jgi:hypothetical protein
MYLSMCCRYMSIKIAWLDPFWNPNIARRELLKPKFYDVWFEVSRRVNLLHLKEVHYMKHM